MLKVKWSVACPPSLGGGHFSFPCPFPQLESSLQDLSLCLGLPVSEVSPYFQLTNK